MVPACDPIFIMLYSKNDNQNFRVLPLAPHIKNWDMARTSRPSLIDPSSKGEEGSGKVGGGDEWITHRSLSHGWHP